MYDLREKAKLDLRSRFLEAREEGFQEGLQESDIRLIRILQEILGEPISDASTLEGRSMEQLQAIAADLHDRILRRG